MKSTEFITEGKNHPVIVIDVQPVYNNDLAQDIVNFVVAQTGPVLMFVNAERDKMTDDTVRDVIGYWERLSNNVDEEDYEWDEENEEYIEPESIIDWSRFTIADKGYGYFRSWQSYTSQQAIIKTIRAMYQHRISDSRQFEDLGLDLQEFLGADWNDNMADDPLTVDWTSVAQLKRFSGAYVVGGGRDECLWEVITLMSAFNIKYKLIDSLIYG